jgi:hypothetical protein
MRARAATAGEAKGAPALPRSSGLRRYPNFRTRTLSGAAFPFKIPKISRSGSKRTPEARRSEARSGERRTCSTFSGGTIPRSASDPGVPRTPGRSSRSSWPPTDARCRKAASTPAMQPPFRCRAVERKPDDYRPLACRSRENRRGRQGQRYRPTKFSSNSCRPERGFGSIFCASTRSESCCSESRPAMISAPRPSCQPA